MATTLHIKNMVCPRCITAVEDLLRKQQLGSYQVELGNVSLEQEPSPAQLSNLRSGLAALGFELLESSKSVLVSQIKTLLVTQIHQQDIPLHVTYSSYLAEALQQEYSSLSRLFSAVEGLTIEKYITRLKIEKAKELLLYDELSLASIASRLGYSSSAYLSSQFKKETGMTITQFKQQHRPGRRSIDSL